MTAGELANKDDVFCNTIMCSSLKAVVSTQDHIYHQIPSKSALHHGRTNFEDFGVVEVLPYQVEKLNSRIITVLESGG